ncbi:MAG: TonB-dependent receptor, partial [Prevotellaceae bacterium]|nr:TonB-dependent receptor [Prevotellaceae bacterium]
MRHFIVFLLLLISFDAMAVDKVLVRGKVIDEEQEPVAGATVTVLNRSLGVNTNAKGEYLLTLPAGKASITVSFTGYKTKTVEYDLQTNTNNVDFTLEKNPIALESVTVTAQQREQQLMDIPITISAVSAQTLESSNIRNPEQLSDFVPGLNIRVQTPHRPTFVIRGLSSDEVSPTAQPRVSVYFNNIPTSRASMALTELYDMERVEVAKGPQGTLFGRGAQIGAINFISRKPTDDLGGYLSASGGNFATKEVQGAINVPIVKNKLMARASGIYSYQDGYVKNLSGGDNLNGKNTFGGRLALAYQPIEKLRFDLMVNYQKDDNPGTAFMSKKYPNSNGGDIFSYETSLDPEKTWYNKRDVLLSSFDVKYYFNANNYLSYATSFTKNTADHHWDGDGTVAPAIDMTEGVKANQFSQEIRYNYSINSRLNGFVGESYWREDVKYKHSFSPNEQYFGHLYLPILADGIDNAYGMGGMLSGGVKQELDYYNLFTPLTSLPVALQMLLTQGGMSQIPPLTTNHSEESNNGAVNQSYDIFADATYKITSKLSVTAGIRAAFEAIETTTEAHITGGDPATMGMLAGTYPNVFY